MRNDVKLLDLHRHAPTGGLFQFSHAEIGPSNANEIDPFASPEITSAIAARLFDIQDHERRRIGQELHDSAGQLLVSLQLSVARLARMEPNDSLNGLIEEIQNTVRQIDEEIRTLAFLHHPAELRGRSLHEALQTLVHGFCRRTGIRVNFKCADDRAVVEESISVAILRVVQEALVNVYRHARATSAKVVLKSDWRSLQLTVSDDGVGFSPVVVDSQQGRGIGVQGMRDRVEMHGGTFDIRGLKRGTKISVTMPLRARLGLADS